MLNNAILVIPAEFAAAIPTGASSITAQFVGVIPIRSAATRNTCGSGLPRVTSLPVTRVLEIRELLGTQSFDSKSDVFWRSRRADRQTKSGAVQIFDQLDRPVHRRKVAGHDVPVQGFFPAVEFGDFFRRQTIGPPMFANNFAARATECRNKLLLRKAFAQFVGHEMPALPMGSIRIDEDAIHVENHAQGVV